jgi:hypothetical protein
MLQGCPRVRIPRSDPFLGREQPASQQVADHGIARNQAVFQAFQ